MPLVKVASYFPVRWSLYLEKVKAPDWSSLVQQEEEERIIYYESAGICSSIGIRVRIEYIETDCLVALRMAFYDVSESRVQSKTN